MNQESALEFPCEFPIKAFGHDRDGFDTVVVDLVRDHAPGITIDRVRSRNSRAGRYVAVTVVVRAENRQQLDAIYQALSRDQRVLFAL